MSNKLHARGFLMPSVVIISVGLLIIALALTELITSNDRAVTRGMYSQVAQTAAKSGVDYAKEQFVSTGAYNGTGETTVVQNGRYRVTFTVTVLSTSSDGLKKQVESVGKVYLPELSATQLLLRTVRSDIIRTSATTLTPNQLSPMAWYDADDNPTLHGLTTNTVNWTTLNSNKDDYLNERVSNGTQSNSSWNNSWMGLGYNSILNADVYAGFLFDLSSVPKGAAITSAYLQTVSQGTTIGLSNIAIEALTPASVPNSNVFSGPPASNQLRGKATEGTPVDWALLDWPIGSQAHQSPDIKNLVQTVLDDPAFVPATKFFGLRLHRSAGLGTHRVVKGSASLIVNYTVAIAGTVSNGQSVVTWDDKSGNGRHLNATAGAQPTYLTSQQNGRAMVGFTSGQYMNTAVFNLASQAQAGTLFVVSKDAAASGSGATVMQLQGSITAEPNCVGSSSCTTRTYELARSGNGTPLTFYIERSGGGGASSLTAQADPVFNGAASMITGGVAFATTGCNPSLDKASADIANGNTTVSTCPSSGSYPKSFQNNLTLSAGTGRNGAIFSGAIGEMIFYNKQLSCQQTQSIQKYLRAKWFNDTTDNNVITCPAPHIPAF